MTTKILLLSLLKGIYEMILQNGKDFVTLQSKRMLFADKDTRG